MGYPICPAGAPRLIGTRVGKPLCDAVIGIGEGTSQRKGKAPTPPTFDDSQTLLERLEAANLFVVPLDDRRVWYRYHRLFADLLQARLMELTPDQIPELHRRASVWEARFRSGRIAIGAKSGDPTIPLQQSWIYRA